MPMKSIRTPFANMSFTPDVPSTNLQPNEYNDGYNVETDVRGIRSVNGSQEILRSVPGTPNYISGGYRADDNFWLIVATDEGKWWAAKDATGWTDITPGGQTFSGYNQALNITESWNGTVPFFNDTINPPMFWADGATSMTLYSNSLPITIGNIGLVNANTQQITFQNVFNSIHSNIAGNVLTIGNVSSGNVSAGQYLSGTGVATGTYIVQNITSGPGSDFGNASTWRLSANSTVTNQAIAGSPVSAAPYAPGEQINISGVDNYYNGIFTVVSSTITTINYTASPQAAYPGGGTVSPQYSWNYNPNWRSVSAYFMRAYNTPNVGTILVAGDLTATLLDGTQLTYPVTVQWSQAFGLNQAPLTWTPTVTNVANQLEVPLRGPALDAFPSNGQFFLCSYWDTVVFSPINYSTTSAPILGVALFTRGRGVLASNCWAEADNKVYGIDSRDIWVFDGQSFKGIGNQRVKNWFYDQLDPRYVDRVFMRTNTQKNQIEIYYSTVNAYNGVPDKMLSYRFDLDCWNAPRDVSSATMACESPVWVSNVANYGSRTLVYARGQTNVQILQKDQGFSFANGAAISSQFRRDNIKLLPDYNNHIMIHRILPEVVNLDSKGIPLYPSTGNIGIRVEGAYSVGNLPAVSTTISVPIATDYPWAQIDQNEYRVNTIELSNTSNTNVWLCSAITWQGTQVEDDR
jgi:hypothetical protein